MSDGYEYEYTPSSESKFKPKLDKLKEFFSKLKENASFGKKFFAIIVAIIAIASIGSLTSYASMVLKQKEREIANVQSRLNFCQAKLEDCENQKEMISKEIEGLNSKVENLNQQINSCIDEKSSLQQLYESCNEEKSVLADDLSSCQANLSSCQNKYESASLEYESLARNFASFKCCPDFEYYVISDNNVLCCLKSGENFLCGKGLTYSESEVEKLNC